MKREEKAHIVQVLHDELQRAQAVFVTDYMGLNVERITRLRRDVANSGGSYRVVKNTLLRRATGGTNADVVSDLFVG
ncbi:MAG TPA: 50S ribosomal protein L10, partial [Deltaproteobacteria bacterium]|nr:50S ribosomal protein L10 [Deltaproteobacteria bacterium]